MIGTNDAKKSMKVLILTNHQLGLYKFRRELLEELVSKKYHVIVSVPGGEFSQDMRDMGVKLVLNKCLDRRGTNPVHDLRLLNYWNSMLKKVKPDVVLTYTIKPNVYGGYLCGKLGIPYIANVTGLGTSIQNGGLIQKFTLALYKVGLKQAEKIFFQNEENLDFMLRQKIVEQGLTDILPGSGVNIDQHYYEPYPDNSEKIIFTIIGRIMKDKGIDEVLGAAEILKAKYPKMEFRLIGDFDEEYEGKVRELEKRGIVKYLGFQKDIHPFVAESHAIIHASYHEGMSNILQEVASTGRPVIATDIHGCIEIYEDGVTGIGFKARNTESLVTAIEKFMDLTNEERAEMGRKGREKMIQEFDRRIVVDKYIAEIRKVLGK